MSNEYKVLRCSLCSPFHRFLFDSMLLNLSFNLIDIAEQLFMRKAVEIQGHFTIIAILILILLLLMFNNFKFITHYVFMFIILIRSEIRSI